MCFKEFTRFRRLCTHVTSVPWLRPICEGSWCLLAIYFAPFPWTGQPCRVKLSSGWVDTLMVYFQDQVQWVWWTHILGGVIPVMGMVQVLSDLQIIIQWQSLEHQGENNRAERRPLVITVGLEFQHKQVDLGIIFSGSGHQLYCPLAEETCTKWLILPFFPLYIGNITNVLPWITRYHVLHTLSSSK